jgi:hypothetical protein
VSTLAPAVRFISAGHDLGAFLVPHLHNLHVVWDATPILLPPTGDPVTWTVAGGSRSDRIHMIDPRAFVDPATLTGRLM